MAVSFVQALGTGNSSNSATGTQVATTATVTAGNYILVVCGRFCSTGPSTLTVTGGGLTWTPFDSGNGQRRITIALAQAPAGLASGTTLTTTHSTQASDAIMGVFEYTNLDTATPTTASGSGTGSTAAWSSGNVTGASGDCLVGGAFVDAGAVTGSTPAAGTERLDLLVGGQSETLTVVEENPIAGTDAIAGTWNTTGGWAAVAVSLKSAAGGGASTITAAVVNATIVAVHRSVTY